MAKAATVWGIDIGQVALKALKVRKLPDNQLQVEAFEIIEHSKILSQPDADRSQLIRGSLESFLSRHSVSGSQVAISVPGHTGFTRFVKLPPVDAKKIPDIVRYEAEQQIPFPIAEVNWRWQTFFDPSSPDVEVGIFAMKRTDITQVLDQLSYAGLQADLVQMAPLALCNFLTYDNQLSPEGATLLVDVGADKTDLVVSDGPRIWTRTIQIGGNNFTDALTRAFKLSFPKAEKLKRTAATSKYARQIFQAMRPVFADLVQEIQRSIGYYTSLHRETRFRRLVGLGNGFRLPGLQKFLEQNLSIPVVRIDSYNRLAAGEGVNAPTFQENVLSLAVAYGLAVQALNEPRVQINLLPAEVARRRLWNRKRSWFAAVAAAILALVAMPTFRSFADQSTLRETSGLHEKATSILQELASREQDYRKLINQGLAEQGQIEGYIKLLGYRDYWPSVIAMVSESINRVSDKDQELLTEYGQAQDEDQRKEILKKLEAKPRDTRKLITILELKTTYVFDVENLQEVAKPAPTGGGLLGATAPPPATAAPPVATAGGKPLRPGFKVELTARTSYRSDAINKEIIARLREESQTILGQMPSVKFESFEQFSEVTRYSGIASAVTDASDRTGGSSGAATGAEEAGAAAELARPDPLFPKEDMSDDRVFFVRWVLSVQSDGVQRFAKEGG